MLKRSQDVLLIDGYNMIGDWPELIRLKNIGLEEARDRLLNMLADYQGYTGIKIYVIFDAHQISGVGGIYKQHRLTVIYTKEKETADECIERICAEWISKRRNVYVATSDMAEQHVVFGQGALRMSARELLTEVKQNSRAITHHISEEVVTKRNTLDNRLKDDVKRKLEQIRRGEDKK